MAAVTVHLVGLPHTALDSQTFSTCAFTAKAARWPAMLRLIGRDITVYWGGGPTSVDTTVRLPIPRRQPGDDDHDRLVALARQRHEVAAEARSTLVAAEQDELA